MQFRWNLEKDAWLKQERGISFYDVLVAYEQGRVMDLRAHPRKPLQMLILFRKDTYVYVVPCVRESKNVYFLKTIYPSRKATKKYLSI